MQDVRIKLRFAECKSKDLSVVLFLWPLGFGFWATLSYAQDLTPNSISGIISACACASYVVLGGGVKLG